MALLNKPGKNQLPDKSGVQLASSTLVLITKSAILRVRIVPHDAVAAMELMGGLPPDKSV